MYFTKRVLSEDIDRSRRTCIETGLGVKNMKSAEHDIIIDICRDSDVSMVGIFGSTARGEDSAHSDIDILVRFAKPVSLLSLVKLERRLSEALGRRVDRLSESAISAYLRDRILKDLLIIYGKR